MPVAIGPAPRGFALLTATERERAARFRSCRALAEFVTLRAALRELLGTIRDEDPAQVPISLERTGKPRVRDDHPQFSLSHTDGLGLIALAPDRPVGVDVEYVDGAHLSGELEQMLTHQELGGLSPACGEGRLRGFLAHWTCKEALAKVSGEGLAAGFERITIHERSLSGEPAPATPARPNLAAGASVAAIDLGGRYIAAAAATGGGWCARVSSC